MLKTIPTNHGRRNSFQIGSEIGSGATSHVCRAFDPETGQQCVVKVISKKMVETEDDMRHLRDEILALKSLNHPNIVKYIDSFETETDFQIYMEECPGISLLEYVNNRQGLDEFNSWKIFKQLISVLEFIHERNIVHRDLKPENIIIDDTLHIKVIDFGLCSVKSPDTLLQTFCGSLMYVAPECLKREPYIGWKVDIWSAGVILYAIRAGILPWKSTNIQNVMKEIVFSDVSYPSDFSPALINLLNKILVKDPDDRPSATEISQIDWVCYGPNQIPQGIPHRSSVPSSLKIKELTSHDISRIKRQRRSYSVDYGKPNEISQLPQLIQKQNSNSNPSSPKAPIVSVKDTSSLSRPGMRVQITGKNACAIAGRQRASTLRKSLPPPIITLPSSPANVVVSPCKPRRASILIQGIDDNGV